MTTSPHRSAGAQGTVAPDEPTVGHGLGTDRDALQVARPGAAPCVPTPSPPPDGLSWTLPEGPGCAGYARTVLGEALAQAGAPRSLIGDARLMVSELATNAHQHAGGHGPHELWLYPDPSGGHAREARCAIFDRYFGARLPGYSWTSGDYGRGLSIVQELSDGQWGLLRTFSRRSPHAPGKAVWFAIPVNLGLL